MRTLLRKAPVVALLLVLSACATNGYDGCHGIGCQVDNPDRPSS